MKKPEVIVSPAPVVSVLPFVTWTLKRDGEWYNVVKVERKSTGEIVETVVVEKTMRHIAARDASMRLFDFLSSSEHLP